MPIPDALGWYEINSLMASVCEDGYDTCHGVVDGYSGGVLDTTRNRLICWGGGHNDYAGNELYALSLTNLTWSRLNSKTACGCNEESCDGGVTPNSRHTYNGLAYMENVDKMFVYGGARSNCGYMLQGTWTFSFQTMTWQQRNIGGPTPYAFPSIAAYDKSSGFVFLFDGIDLYTFNDATGLLTKRGTPYLGASDAMTMAIDYTRHKAFLIGSPDNGYFRVSDISAAGGYGADEFQTTPTSTGNDGGLRNVTAPGFDYDPVSDRLIAWYGTGSVYSYNIDTGAWTQITYSGGPSYTDAITLRHGLFGRFRYSPTSGVLVGVAATSLNPYTIRLTSLVEDTEDPTAPADLTAIAVSSSQIDLTWTASTDNVGVTEYEIEQCSGSNCSNFALVHTVAGGLTAYSDTTNLSPSTLYRYRIRAKDAAGNTSTYSNIAEDTTDAADAEAPTAPTNLSAAAQSYSQINLTWTASTDNVGVTGYRLERCAGASCTGFVQIAAPATNSYPDTGLAQNTTYRYRVRATDAAGNLSDYSDIATETTQATSGNILQVGSTKAYTTIAAALAAASAGDIIECDPEIYQDNYGDVTQDNLTIRGIGGYAHFKWDTGDNTTATTEIPNGQAILRMLASNVIFEHLEFSGAKVADGNGSGIRYNGGNFTVRHCYFHNNQSGILGQSAATIPGPTLIVEYNIFDTNGYYQDGFYAHNIYIGQMPQFIFRFNKSIDPVQGHCFKSRAELNEIISNYFSTKNSDGSMEVELPNGHVAYVIGNVIEQGDASENSTMLSYGAEGLTNFVGKTTYHHLYVVNNTFYNWRTAGCTRIQMVNSPTVYKAVNNAYDNGGGTFRSGTATSITESNNAALSDTDWVDPANGDFHLVETATTAIDQGIDPGLATGAETFSLTPQYEYSDVASKATRTAVNANDVGSYEYGSQDAPPTGKIPFSKRT